MTKAQKKSTDDDSEPKLVEAESAKDEPGKNSNKAEQVEEKDEKPLTEEEERVQKKRALRDKNKGHLYIDLV